MTNGNMLKWLRNLGSFFKLELIGAIILGQGRNSQSGGAARQTDCKRLLIGWCSSKTVKSKQSSAKSKHSASFCESLESGIAEMIGKLRILGISTFANFLDSMHSCNFRMDFEIGKLETELKRWFQVTTQRYACVDILMVTGVSNINFKRLNTSSGDTVLRKWTNLGTFV